MTISDLLRETAPKLQPKKIVCDEDRTLGRLEAEILLAHVLKKNRVWVLGNHNFNVPSSAAGAFEKLVERRMKHEPIAYILGEKEFYGRTFLVNKDVLVPRPETELLIDLAKQVPANVIWDVGTGSGAIAVTLADEIPGADILATDVSRRAIDVTKKNAKLHNTKTRITFLRSDLLQPKAYNWLKRQAINLAPAPRNAKRNERRLLICANLPYLPTSDAKVLDADVTKFEPKRALYSGKDGLDLITRLLKQLARHLPEWNYKTATLLFEFDPPQAAKLKKLAKGLFPDAEISITKDLAGRNRVLRITSTL